jgi:hypothetical protein
LSDISACASFAAVTRHRTAAEHKRILARNRMRRLRARRKENRKHPVAYYLIPLRNSVLDALVR